jgi:hypothetical protein
MPVIKCREEDVLEVLRRSLREGRAIRNKDELVKELVKRCGYRDVSGAYKLIKRLEKKGILKHAPGYGYTVPAEKESGHDRLIMQTLAILLDMAWDRNFNINAKNKSLKDYYGERIPILAVKELMGNALLHIATSREDLAKELKEIARLGLLEKYEDLLKGFYDKIDELDEIVPKLPDMVKLKQLEEIAGVLSRFYRVLVGEVRSFYIDAMATGRPKGWCRICAEWIDQELSHSIESLINWLENREPEEISYILEKWDPKRYLRSLEGKLRGY